MKRNTKLILVVLLALSSLALRFGDEAGLTATYGVAADDPARLELKLNPDFTFTYQDLSRADRPLRISGTYALSKRGVVLLAADSAERFHDKWRITEDGRTAKSRDRLAFYTLSRVE